MRKYRDICGERAKEREIDEEISDEGRPKKNSHNWSSATCQVGVDVDAEYGSGVGRYPLDSM